MFNYRVDEEGYVIEEIIGEPRKDYIQVEMQIDATKMIYDHLTKQFTDMPKKPKETYQPIEIVEPRYTKEELLSMINAKYIELMNSNYQSFVMAAMSNDEDLKQFYIDERKEIQAQWDVEKAAVQ